MLVTFPLHAATLLPPGGSISPVEGVTVPANIDSFVIDDIETDFFFAPFAGAPFLSGHVDEAVLHDPFGLTCPTCLDFAFQVKVDIPSSYSVYQAALANFFGSTVNVGYGIDTGNIVPDSAFRGAGGGLVGFRFGTDANPTLGPDDNSVFVLIATNATKYDTSGIIGINGSNFTGEGSCAAGVYTAAVVSSAASLPRYQRPNLLPRSCWAWAWPDSQHFGRDSRARSVRRTERSS